MIRKATPEDVASISFIYNHYILNSTSTFEENSVDEFAILERIQSNAQLDWWFFESDTQIVGYAYATYWKPRSAYRYTLETSIYIAPNYQKKGIGKQLYTHMIEILKSLEFRSLLAGISLPNEGSVRFHEALGFRKVGQLEKVGFKFNRWIDVGYWELNLKTD